MRSESNYVVFCNFLVPTWMARELKTNEFVCGGRGGAAAQPYNMYD